MAGKIILIAAVDEEMGIGKEGRIPWHYPEDMRHFKRTTLGHNVIMGRKTWESLGGALGGRTNIVLSYSRPEGYRDGARFERYISPLLGRSIYSDEDFYVIGGQQIYEKFLPHADEVILTLVPGEYDCDTFFPDMDSRHWDLTDCLRGNEVRFYYYKRR